MGHGVPRVDQKIPEHLIYLRALGVNERQVFFSLKTGSHLFTEKFARQVHGVGDGFVEVNRLSGKLLLASIGEQRSNKSCGFE